MTIEEAMNLRTRERR